MIATPALREVGISGVGSTSPGKITLTAGGVGRNIAEAAHRILSVGPDPRPDATLLVSPIGDDLLADHFRAEARKLKMRTDGFISVAGSRTATCNMFLDNVGSLLGGIADMDIIAEISREQVSYNIREKSHLLLTTEDRAKNRKSNTDIGGP